MKDFKLLPFQLSMILGTPYREVLDWIEEEKLKTNGDMRVPLISISDISDFLGQNRECVGQLYCDCSVPIYNEWRQLIIEEMDRKWPLEVVK